MHKDIQAVHTGYPRFFHTVFHIDMHVMLAALFFAALVLYGAFGSPTPDDPGVLELMLGMVLVICVGASGFARAFDFKQMDAGWVFAGSMLLIFGMSIPVLTALITGNDFTLIIRDVLPFLFMLLPVLFLHFDGRIIPWILGGVLSIGVLFSVRAVFALPYLGGGDALFYLGNMPSVLFTAVFCAGLALQIFVQRFSLRSLLSAALLAALAALCVWPILETQQRASIGVFIFSLAFLCVSFFRAHPARVMIVFMIGVAGVLVFRDFWFAVFETLRHKTALVGVGNMRVQEWQAVWAEISAQPLTLFFGKGWGAVFSSPAVADIRVNFTHGLLSSLLLKTGVLGLLMGCVYLTLIVKALVYNFNAHRVLVIALLGPLLIDVFLYASFKSLDFGLILLLASLYLRNNFSGAFCVPCVENKTPVVYENKSILASP